MGKLSRTANESRVRVTGRSPVVTSLTPTTVTAQGGPGFTRSDVKSELFLLAVTNFVSESTTYEDAKGRDTRYADLVQAATLEDPLWTLALLRWLRHEAGLRSAPIVGAAEFIRAQVTANPGAPTLGRAVVRAVLKRADEPGELVGYWLSKYGRPLPKPLKKGVADAVQALYNERALAKWDSARNPIRFGDVIELSDEVRPRAPWQSDLFRYAMESRRGRGTFEGKTLPMLELRDKLMKLPDREATRTQLLADPTLLASAGMTWEDLSSFGKMDAAAWDAVIPSMGYLALLRNLRNFDAVGISRNNVAFVQTTLADKFAVARSGVLPMQIASAYRAVVNDRWKPALQEALDLSMLSVPPLGGHTLIMVDVSGSMIDTFSKDGSFRRWEAAALFGLTLAARSAKATVVAYSNTSMEFTLSPGENTLAALSRFYKTHFIGNGTCTITETYRWAQKVAPDRVVIVTDEQTASDASTSRYYYDKRSRPESIRTVDDVVSPTTPLYTFNVAGYKVGHASSGTRYRHTVGGLSDGGFKMISMIESSRPGVWPWES